ncbi:hypothetical protein JCGZ_03785 [Jatropha curcas]|uniref:MYB family protein n=1 Tax=Jatropha curcas TaxID=180498 RepID=A0A067LA46_JATCU|nr:MYB family protein [Jatropha curcas]KDP40989.1 hypothetical protein JCGZ_03785 [Jatropha curcas]
MGHRCCTKQKVKRGLWSPEEDEKLIKYITTYGHGSWSSVPKLAGLQRCGKSCRLRWINYLRPDLKRGSFSANEEQIIIDVHRILGNRWAQIAKHLPGRTDNEVKNFWNSCIKKKLISQGLDPKTHNLIPSHQRANNKVVSNLPQSHQQPFPIISVNSSQMEIKKPIRTLPADARNIETSVAPILASVDQNPNILWTVNDSIISSSSPSSLVVNPSGFGVLDENFYLGTNNTINIVEPFEPPRLEVLQEQEQENLVKEKLDESKGINDIDASFDSSGFGLDFVESTLFSSSMCRELSSMDDLAWNF